MNFGRREFLQILAAASTAGLALDHPASLAAAASGSGERLYELPSFGQLSLLHLTDCHAQLTPTHYREPSMNLGLGSAAGRPPHLVGEALLKAYDLRPGTARAHAFSHLDFVAAAEAYGEVGGFAHLATLVKQMRASRPHSLLLDGGDTWQGSATALWTQGQDMVTACKLLGVDIMTGHWEFTLGAERVRALVEGELKGHIEFLAQNVRTADFGDPVFPAVSHRVLNGIDVAIIGQAFPYTPIAHPRHLVPDWTFGIQEEALQAQVDQARSDGAAVVVLLSHNGMDVDLKLASRVAGIDAILGGHTHDAVPVPVIVRSPRGGQTVVTNAGSNGKFLGVLDLDVRGGRVRDFRYTLLPVFARLLRADREMAKHVANVRAPFAERLGEPLAQNEALLYRRGNFNGTWDQLILDALMAVRGADIALSPGFRWGTTLLPGETITRGALMDQLAITYPQCTLTDLSGIEIKGILEDVCDNLFNPDPYLQQGGDMVRVGGLQYRCEPGAAMGSRISDLRLKGQPLEADRRYRVAGWASVADAPAGPPVWEVVEAWLRQRGHVTAPALNTPDIVGQDANAGRSPAA